MEYAIIISVIAMVVIAAFMLLGGNAEKAFCSLSNSIGAAAWCQQSPGNSPPARIGPVAADDPVTNRLVMFGGAGVCGATCNDTWTWTGTTWNQLSPATSPSARWGSQMALDPVTKRLILFGGLGAAGVPLADTWTWTGMTWSQLSPATSPPGRYGAGMAVDANGRIVLFGGSSTACLICNDTWTWTGATWAQVAANPAGCSSSCVGSPPGREYVSMATYPGNGNIIMFGGSNTGAGPGLGDTWSWNGTAWSQLSPATSPSQRFDAITVVDPGLGTVVVFGGGAPCGSKNDTWAWSGSTWNEINSPTSPAGRCVSVMGVDPTTNHDIMFSGGDQPWPNYLTDTWSI